MILVRFPPREKLFSIFKTWWSLTFRHTDYPRKMGIFGAQTPKKWPQTFKVPASANFQNLLKYVHRKKVNAICAKCAINVCDDLQYMKRFHICGMYQIFNICNRGSALTYVIYVECRIHSVYIYTCLYLSRPKMQSQQKPNWTGGQQPSTRSTKPPDVPEPSPHWSGDLARLK